MCHGQFNPQQDQNSISTVQSGDDCTFMYGVPGEKWATHRRISHRELASYCEMQTRRNRPL